MTATEIANASRSHCDRALRIARFGRGLAFGFGTGAVAGLFACILTLSVDVLIVTLLAVGAGLVSADIARMHCRHARVCGRSYVASLRIVRAKWEMSVSRQSRTGAYRNN